jgi:hypothetical protein
MIDPIFIRIPNDQGKIYPSYTDLYEVIYLSEFPACEYNEIEWDNPEKTYIYSPSNPTNEEGFGAHKDKKCKLILIELEWMGWWEDENHGWKAGDLHGLKTGEKFAYLDEIWCPDRYQHELYQKLSTVPSKYFFLGGHPHFGGEHEEEKYDFCHLAYNWGTRLHKMEMLMNMGYSMAPDGWGDTKRHSLKYSKWGLALQQFPIPFITPQRWLLFASWKLPILYDFVKDPYPYKAFGEERI